MLSCATVSSVAFDPPSPVDPFHARGIDFGGAAIPR
jgi:hypothetical protein